ncbi:MAG: hypothetical protein R2856_37860 [Caldilineaceae bacterium]
MDLSPELVERIYRTVIDDHFVAEELDIPVGAFAVVSGPTGGEPLAKKKVALVHDWLNQMGSAENVLEELVDLFPGAPLHQHLRA